ncbi:hypothetical protein [uncultured Xanthomonas sp.]|uniref:hypothetical protein n=1 Tax=uncultured Xanthomonas sp. TaxID=152831 RepID=UPI0025EE4AF5|nr:hypothetical protein [uncultured Xanthomonas sp.]
MDRALQEETVDRLRRTVERLARSAGTPDWGSSLADVAREVAAASSAALPSSDHPLHQRAVTDLSTLQETLSEVVVTMSDPQRFQTLLASKGQIPEVMQQHLALMEALDRALGCIVGLMQYDVHDRYLLDSEDGFMISSGSMSYGRSRFRGRAR